MVLALRLDIRSHGADGARRDRLSPIPHLPSKPRTRTMLIPSEARATFEPLHERGERHGCGQPDEHAHVVILGANRKDGWPEAGGFAGQPFAKHASKHGRSTGARLRVAQTR